MMREVEVRSRPPVPLQPDWEWWVDYPHRLAARVRADQAVVELGRWELAPGLHGSVVRRLRPRPPGWRRPALISTGATLAGLTLAWMLWVLVQSLVAAVVLLWPLGLAYVGLRLVTGHRPACVGLHCPGCRG